MFIVLQRYTFLYNRMEVYIKFLVFFQIFIQIFQHAIDLFTVIIRLNIMITLSTPRRHIGKRSKFLIFQLLTDFLRFFLIFEKTVSRVSIHDNFSRIKRIEIVVLHHHLFGKFVWKHNIAGLQKIMLYIIHGLNSKTHLLAQCFQRSSMPGLKINLFLTSDKICRKRTVINQIFGCSQNFCILKCIDIYQFNRKSHSFRSLLMFCVIVCSKIYLILIRIFHF